MTKARDLSSLIGSSGQIDNTKITLDANEIPNLDANKIATGSLGADRIPGLAASKITSGTFDDARIAASNVSQHATSFDDNKLVNDISTLALRQASDQNKSAYNTNSQSVDVFQDDTGIDTTTNVSRNASEYVNSVTTSASTPSYDSGDRQSSYTVTKTSGGAFTGYSGAITSWIDGAADASTNTSWYFDTGQTVSSSDNITFDLGSGNSKIYSGAKIIQNSNTTCGTWVWQGSNDGSTYVDLSAGFTWGSSATTEQTWSNDTAYRYIRIRGVSGTTSGGPWQHEVNFQTKTISSSFNATGNFTGTTITAPSSVSSMGAIITYQDNAGTNALNTDIVLQLSADGGSNYSTATLTALPDFSTGIKMAKVNDLAVTSGTSLKYKLSFANQASGSKEARIRGVSLQY
jgi:hypothetical protein